MVLTFFLIPVSSRCHDDVKRLKRHLKWANLICSFWRGTACASSSSRTMIGYWLDTTNLLGPIPLKKNKEPVERTNFRLERVVACRTHKGHKANTVIQRFWAVEWMNQNEFWSSSGVQISTFRLKLRSFTIHSNIWVLALHKYSQNQSPPLLSHTSR